jgi:cell wall-associated NlpC family hydrolase
MSRNLRKKAVGLILILPILLLAACSGPPAPAKSKATQQLVVSAAGKKARVTALDTARSMLGVAYRFGGADPRGFDCSGLVHYSYARAGVRLPRTAQAIFRASQLVDPRDVQAGDLVFFTISSKKIAHVGIYADSNRFIHAPSSGKSVSYASLGNPYWKNRLVAVGRF